MGTDIWVTFEHKLKGGFVSFRKAVWRSLSGPWEPGCGSDYLARATGAAVRRGRVVPAIAACGFLWWLFKVAVQVWVERGLPLGSSVCSVQTHRGGREEEAYPTPPPCAHS